MWLLITGVRLKASSTLACCRLKSDPRQKSGCVMQGDAVLFYAIAVAANDFDLAFKTLR